MSNSHYPGGLEGTDRLMDLIRRASPLVEASPCHCIAGGGTDQAPTTTFVCARCTFLADAQNLEDALFFVAAAGCE